MGKLSETVSFYTFDQWANMDFFFFYKHLCSFTFNAWKADTNIPKSLYTIMLLNSVLRDFASPYSADRSVVPVCYTKHLKTLKNAKQKLLPLCCMCTFELLRSGRDKIHFIFIMSLMWLMGKVNEWLTFECFCLKDLAACLVLKLIILTQEVLTKGTAEDPPA